MTTRKRFTITLALSVFALALIAISPARSTRANQSRDRTDEPPMFNVTPPVTLGYGQTFRITYLNVAGNPFEISPCFLDGDGAHIKMGAAFRLMPGQAYSFDLSRAEAGRTEPIVAVRGGVHVHKQNLNYLTVSGEVVEDATGKSTLFVAGLNNPPDPFRDREYEPSEGAGGRRATSLLSPVGISFGQKLRINFVNVGANPFEVAPCFFDSDGEHIKSGDPVTLLPGQTRSFEMSRSEIVNRGEPRVQLYSGVHVANANLKGLMLTGEVIDETSGRSNLYVPGLTGPPKPVKEY